MTILEFVLLLTAAGVSGVATSGAVGLLLGLVGRHRELPGARERRAG